MTTFQLFGPVTITHGGSDQGKSKGGVEVRLLSVKREPVGDSYDVEEVVYGADGVVHSYEHGSSQIVYGHSANPQDLTSYGELIFDGDYMKLTLHSAKLSLPNNYKFGTFQYNALDLRIVARKDANNKVYTLSPK